MRQPERMTMTASAFPTRLQARSLRLSLVLAAASLCAACSSMDNIMSPSLNYKPSAVTAAQNSAGGPSDQLVRLPLASTDLECPLIDVQDGAASLRVGGADNASVRYQFDISDTARECDPAPGNQFALKVGVSGHLAIGPAGKPGAYSAPLRITVANAHDEKAVFSKAYKIDANTGTAAETVFRFVSDPIVLPMARTELIQDYTITIGFDNGHKDETPHPRKRHVAKADAAAH
jgi:hypothetical protein